MGDIEILVPVATTRIEERPLAPRPQTLRGLKLGVLDNGKANAGRLLDTVTEALIQKALIQKALIQKALIQKVGDLELVREQKVASEGAPSEVMGRLQCCDAVLLAIAD